MKGDFTRDPLKARDGFTRVLMQQGRVQLDADWNALNAVLLNRFRSFIVDLIGFHAGPKDRAGFKIAPNSNTISVGTGRYYVDGIACQNRDKSLKHGVKDLLGEKAETDRPYLVYLEVWERHVTYIEDEAIGEVALHGLDTTTRAKVEWRVRIKPSEIDANVARTSRDLLREDVLMSGERAIPKLVARLDPGTATPSEDPCIVSPEARYTGAENQLYRVEIHGPGTANRDTAKEAGATFKWSRDNGSVVFPLREPWDGSVIKLEHLGRDSRMSLQVGDWVELVDDDYIRQERADPLLQVVEIDRTRMEVTLSDGPAAAVEMSEHPLLRRWDHKPISADPNNPEQHGGAVPIKENSDGDAWLDLEDGIQIQFASSDGESPPRYYRTGDYWLIPARTVTRDVEWQQDEKKPPGQEPHGVERHYAPLALLTKVGDTIGSEDLRLDFKALVAPL